MNEIIKKKAGRPVGSYKGKWPTSIGRKPTLLRRKWCSMHARCYQESHPANEHYRSLGITVCERWHGFEGFQAFCDDMGECPPGLTLERVDNSKGYGPDNCRWATWQEQAENRENKGRPVDLMSWRQICMVLGVPYHRTYQRLRLGWPLDLVFGMRSL